MAELTVHPSAVIDPAATVAADVEIGPFVVIEAGVTVGARTRLLAGTVLRTGTSVAEDCELGPYAVLGSPPMDSAFRGEESFVTIGKRVQIREFATVHRATGAGAATVIGPDSLVMNNVHVSHNVTVGRGVTLTAGSQLGGHSSVGDHAVLGASAHLHQFVRVGELAMVGALAGLNRDALPFTLLHGMFAEHYGLNRVGLTRHGFAPERYRLLEQAFRALRRRDEQQLAELVELSEDAARLQEFIAGSQRGISRIRGSGR